MTAQKTDITPQVIEGVRDRKGKAITIIDLKRIPTAPTGKFIICQGTSTQQVMAIADSVREYVQKECGRKPYNYDGYRNAQWIVLDYGEIMVHVFVPETRTLYNLEELWADADVTQMPDLD